MAEIKEGILDGVNGTVGTVVGFRWRGRNYIRSKPRKSNKPATEAQILSRTKMGMVSTFASKFKDIVNRHCPPALLNEKMAPGKEQLISMLTKEGVVIIDEIPCIEISAAILSIGSLPPAVIKKINMLKTGRVKVAWDNSIVNLMTKATYRLTLVAYHEDLELATEIETLGKREDKFVHFDLPKEWTEGNVHFWSIWRSADGVRTSTSAYHGILSLGEEENGLQSSSNEEEIGLQIRSNEAMTTEKREWNTNPLQRSRDNRRRERITNPH
ncbi:DUF6266 family protein [Myroides sp.]|uniref:DUF6266 family protein n=1 Tax=Myroides sp. TaxID=1874736 RepID=UPI003F34E691